MKGKLEFNLPEEREDHENAVMANKAFYFIFEFDQYLRTEYKYNDNEAAGDIRQRFRDMAFENEINIDGGTLKKVKQKWSFRKWLNL